MYPYLFHTTSRESKKSLSGARQPDYWINRFENHKYFDTHQAPVFDSVNIKALLQHTSRESKKSLSGARQPDYWINRFENHKYFDTHQAPVFDSVNIKALLQQKQQSNIPEKE